MTSLQVRPSNATLYGLVVTWGPPSDSNYPTPVTYQVSYRERPSSGPPGSWSITVERNDAQREYTTPTLKPGTRYEVMVWTVTSIGFGTGIRRTEITHQGMTYTTSYIVKILYFVIYFTCKKALHLFFIYPAPGPVMALNVTTHPTNIALIVTWRPPTGPTRPPVIGYKVQYRKAPDGEWSKAVQTRKQMKTLSDLKPATNYEVQVWAFSSIGEDPLSKRMDSGTTGGRECTVAIQFCMLVQYTYALPNTVTISVLLPSFITST